MGDYRYYRSSDDRETDEPARSFPTPSGRARFSTGRHEGIPEPVDEKYPLTFTTARESDGYNTGVRSRGDPDEPADPVARANPATLAAHEPVLQTEESKPTTTIESRRASVSVRVEPDEAVPDGMVWLPIHHPMTNHFTIAATDPESDEPNYKQGAVRLAFPDRDAAADDERADPTTPERSVPADRPARVGQ